MPLITQFPNNLACIENDVKADFEALSLDAYSSLKLQNSPQIEYFGKVPLNRQCAHGKPMEQFKMYAHNISLQCMNELIDMGWRREGNNLYKTYMECCHTYALRLNAQNFKLSKNHRKILNHINDFFKFGNETSENTGRNIKNSKQNKGTNNQQDTSLEAYIRRIFENSEAHKLEVRLVRPKSKVFEETYTESFQLYTKYMERIHNNKFTKENFENTLVSTPFRIFNNEQDFQHFGTFHRQYLIDGKLVGVEVFDTLPNYVVGLTLYYDPDLSHLNLGTFMILSQILYTQQLSKILEKPIYFSSGLYNHCFKKHHYKLQFASEILCCDTQTWITLDKGLLQMLDKEEKIMCEDSSSIEKPEIFSIPCLYNGKVVKYGNLREMLPENDCDIICKRLL